ATSLNVNEEVSGISVYPVPCTDKIFVSGASQGAMFNVIDVSGAVISSGQIRQEMQAVSTTQLPSGMYLLRVFNNDGIVYLRKFLRQ
ncbi:MAG: T9SS type A sorting domain-containing protein, partial [bacterium]